MNSAIEAMLGKYQPKNDHERENVAKEDVLNFLSSRSEIAFWKKELFLSTLSALKAD